MIQETMTAQERLQAAISLDYVDRSPVFPIGVSFAPRLYGITQAEAWQDHSVAREAIIRCFQEYGYDCSYRPNFYYPMLPGKFCTAPTRNLIPGRQLPADALYQIDERILFPREDYDKIAALGWNAYWEEHYEKMSGKSMEKLIASQIHSNQLYIDDSNICKERGMPLLFGSFVDSVLMAFSISRTLNEFTKDLYQVPDKVEAAMKATCQDLISNAIQECRIIGLKMVFVVLERGSGFYYRLDVFERFEWPFLQAYVDAFLSEGITPWLHFDTDWGINLPSLNKLPKGKCVCDLDGMTDIFRAKEILRDHMCISGDVSASLMSLGRPEEVKQYCQRLIDEVGDGGGFMLTTGCNCPVNVKPENLRVMVETGKSYQGKKGRTKDQRPVKVKQEAARFAVPKGEIGEALGNLQYDEVMNKVDQAIKAGIDPLIILDECRSGMEKVGELYSIGDYFLSELIMSADIFKKVSALLEPRLLKNQRNLSLGAVVIATPKGDIHDIGKNIVATLLKAGGFDVHDLGVDVSPEAIANRVAETDAKVVAMSALITPTFESMKKVVELLRQRELRGDRFIIIGGGPTTEIVRDYVGADAWTLDPKAGVNMCRDFMEGQGKS